MEKALHEGSLLEELPGGELDLESLEGRVQGWRTECDTLRTFLGAALALPPDHRQVTVTKAPTDGFLCFAGILGRRATDLLARWEDDVLSPLAGPREDVLTRALQDLRMLYSAWVQARSSVEVSMTRKQAAINALTMALETQAAAMVVSTVAGDEDEEDEALEPDQQQPIGGKDEKPGRHKGRRGLGRKIKGIFKHKKKDKEKEIEDRTPMVDEHETAVQEANDELLEAGEEQQFTADELERRAEMCRELRCTTLRNFQEEEVTHGKSVREALREASLALGNWADEVCVALVRHAGDAHSDGGESSAPSTALGPSGGVSGLSSGCSDSDCDEEFGSSLTDALLEERVLHLAAGNDSIQESLPLSSMEDGTDVGDQCTTQAGLALPQIALESASAVDENGDTREDVLGRWTAENVDLQRALQGRMPRLLSRQLRRSCERLGRQATALEEIASLCTSLRCQPNSSTATPSDIGTPLLGLRALDGISSGSTPREQSPHALDTSIMPNSAPSSSCSHAFQSPRHTLPHKPAELVQMADSQEADVHVKLPCRDFNESHQDSTMLNPFGEADDGHSNSFSAASEIAKEHEDAVIGITGMEMEVGDGEACSQLSAEILSGGGQNADDASLNPFEAASLDPFEEPAEVDAAAPLINPFEVVPEVAEPQTEVLRVPSAADIALSTNPFEVVPEVAEPDQSLPLNPFADDSSLNPFDNAMTEQDQQGMGLLEKESSGSGGMHPAPLLGNIADASSACGSGNALGSGTPRPALPSRPLMLETFTSQTGQPHPDGADASVQEQPTQVLQNTHASSLQPTTHFAYSEHSSSTNGADALGSSTPREALPSRPTEIQAFIASTDVRELPETTPHLEPHAVRLVGLMGCMPLRQASGASAAGLVCLTKSVGPIDQVPEAEVKRAFSAGDPMAALAQSDDTLYKGRLGETGKGYWSWDWQSFAIEEGHTELQHSNHDILNFLNEKDWGLLAYEQLLLLQSSLETNDPLLECVATMLPICRVKLEINTLEHHHIAHLTSPDGSQGFFPLDVRCRAALLLRSWVRAEAPCLSDGATGGTSSSVAGLTTAWIRRQLAMLRGDIITRALALQREGRDAANLACFQCLSAVRSLEAVATDDAWGRSREAGHPPELSGRRLLMRLVHNLDLMRPSRGNWYLNTACAAKVFSHLWGAATDEDSEDHLSMDGPTVASVLLSGLHPHLGSSPLRIETHALLLAQQLWLSIVTKAPSAPSGQMSAKALATASGMVTDFAQWLERSSKISTASCFSRRQMTVYSPEQEVAELVIRRLLTVNLRDGLVHALANYRRSLEPDALTAALTLLSRAQECTRCSERLMSCMTKRESDSSGVTGSAGSSREDDASFMCRMGLWFGWNTVGSLAGLALAPYNESIEVPNGDTMAFCRYGPRIKKHLEGLAEAVQSLLHELECEERYYSGAWDVLGLTTSDHLSVALGALCATVQPYICALVSSGMWPTKECEKIEIPAGGGRLLHALEALDRRARRHAEPRNRPGASSLVDILVPHVTAALEDSFRALNRDITSTMDGDAAVVFQPLKPPSLLHCERIVTLWSFVHKALDAPLKIGVPVDIVAQPFLGFLQEAVQHATGRIAFNCDHKDSFRLASRAARVAARLADSSYDSDFENGALQGSGSQVPPRRQGGGGTGKRNKLLWRSNDRSRSEDAPRNTVSDVALLGLESKAVLPPVQEVTVRLSSIGFCLSEMNDIYNKLLDAVNSGDDSGVPTVRHNNARRQIYEELPELIECVQERGQAIATCLAARLVYLELRQPLFEQLYFVPPQVSGSNVSLDQLTPRSSDMLVSFEAVVTQRESGFLYLASQVPSPLLVAFIVELGVQLANALMYIIVDYLAKHELDQIAASIDADLEAFERLVHALMEQVQSRLAVDTRAQGRAILARLTSEECDSGKRKLDAVVQTVQNLAEKVQTGTLKQLSQYASRVLHDPVLQQNAPQEHESRKRTPSARRQTAASCSPRGRSARSVSPRVVSALVGSLRSTTPPRDTGCTTSVTGRASNVSQQSTESHNSGKTGWKKARGGMAKLLRSGSRGPSRKDF